MALIDKLTAIADAIRGKTGKTEEMTLDQMVTEIMGIQTGGGGGGVYSGSLELDAETAVQGLQLNLGLPSRVNFLFMWFDREDFLAIESPVNNYLYTFLILPVGLSEMIPLYRGSGTVCENEYDRIFFVQTNVTSNTASPNGKCVQNLGGAQQGAYGEFLANNDGTVTLNKWGSGSNKMLAGKYNWIAVC